MNNAPKKPRVTPDLATIPLRHGGRIEVEQSALDLECVTVVHDAPGFVVVQVSTGAKYPEPIGTGGDSDGVHSAIVGIGERTLHAVTHASEWTSVLLHGRRGYWYAAVDTDRYHFTVFFWRQARGRSAWFPRRDANG